MNHRNPTVKRIIAELKEIKKTTDEDFVCYPLEDDLFEWHFVFRGIENTPCEGGLYHGRIVLPSEYPLVPPSIIFMTPNGRFETGIKICLSVTEHHPETWQPCWGIKSLIIGVRSVFVQKDHGSIGSMNCSDNAIRDFAEKSLDWQCNLCRKTNREIFHNISREAITPIAKTSPNNVIVVSTIIFVILFCLYLGV